MTTNNRRPLVPGIACGNIILSRIPPCDHLEPETRHPLVVPLQSLDWRIMGGLDSEVIQGPSWAWRDITFMHHNTLF